MCNREGRERIPASKGNTNIAVVVGVDGCKGGWVAARLDCRRMTATLAVHCDFAEVLECYQDAAAIGVDMPIGLGGCEPRACDVLARRELGRRASSIFPAPDRRLLEFSDYAQTLAESRRLCGKGISKQSFYLFSKIREIDRLMPPH